jgi:hypothetical protein
MGARTPRPTLPPSAEGLLSARPSLAAVVTLEFLRFRHQIDGDLFQSVRGRPMRASARKPRAGLRDFAHVSNGVLDHGWVEIQVFVIDMAGRYCKLPAKTCDQRPKICFGMPAQVCASGRRGALAAPWPFPAAAGIEPRAARGRSIVGTRARMR